MKKKILALAASLVLLVSLTACGASSKAESAPAASAPAMEDMIVSESTSDGYFGGMNGYPAEEPAAPAPSEKGETQTTSGQKLIRRASLEMETLDFTSTDASLTDLVESMGGYYETAEVRNRSSGYRSGYYVIRIPAQRFEAFMEQAGSLCHETWRSTSQEDISERYYDTQGRLETQQIKLERLQNLLRQAENMEDIITIESAISECEQYIDDLSGTLRHYDGKVDYATIDLNLREVYQYSNTQAAPTTFGERMGNAFEGGMSSFVDTLEDLAVSFAYSWMWWLMIAAVVFVVLRSGKKARIRRLERKAAKKAEKEDDKQN